MNKFLAAAALGTLALAACKQQGTGVANGQTDSMTNGATVDMRDGNMAAGNMTGASTADQMYVQNAAASDMFEVESSRLAQSKATLPSAKTFAATMIADHGQSTAELKTAAAAAGIPVPTALPADLQAKLDTLNGLSGAAFDRQYLADQRAGHQDTLTKVNAYVASAPAGPLKDHATKVAGVVQKHLTSLEKIK